jgi:hypothetical protein
MSELERFLAAFIPRLGPRAVWGRQLIRNEILDVLGELGLAVPASLVQLLSPSQRWVRDEQRAESKEAR